MASIKQLFYDQQFHLILNQFFFPFDVISNTSFSIHFFGKILSKTRAYKNEGINYPADDPLKEISSEL